MTHNKLAPGLSPALDCGVVVVCLVFGRWSIVVGRHKSSRRAATVSIFLCRSAGFVVIEGSCREREVSKCYCFVAANWPPGHIRSARPTCKFAEISRAFVCLTSYDPGWAVGNRKVDMTTTEALIWIRTQPLFRPVQSTPSLDPISFCCQQPRFPSLKRRNIHLGRLQRSPAPSWIIRGGGPEPEGRQEMKME